MKYAYSLVALIAASTFAVGCTAEPTETNASSSEDELINAPRDKTNTWAVGVCSSEPNADPAKGAIGACVEKGTRCTGSLIAKNLVMTARHCVQAIDYSQAKGFCEGAKFGNNLGAGKVRVTLDPSVLGENVAWRDVAEVITTAGDNACKDDIVILRLAADIADADAKPIAVDARQLAWYHPGKVAVVGRGILTSLLDVSTGATIDDDANGGLLRRYKADIPFHCVSNNPNKPCIIDDYSSPPTNKFSLPSDAYFAIGAGTASGDSGSAILRSAAFKDGRPIAIGVNSAGTWDQDGVGNHGLGVRLDVHAGWLASTLRTKARGAYTLRTSGSSSSNASPTAAD